MEKAIFSDKLTGNTIMQTASRVAFSSYSVPGLRHLIYGGDNVSDIIYNKKQNIYGSGQISNQNAKWMVMLKHLIIFDGCLCKGNTFEK